MKRSALLLVLLASLVVVGCSSGDDDASPAPTEPPDETTTTSQVPEPLDDQTPPPSINGITLQGDTVWIASIAGDEVIQVERSTGAIVARFDTAGAGPDDVAVAPDGSVWVTGFVNGDVGRIAQGSYEVVTTIAPGINPIDIAPDGTVFIGTFGPGGTLHRIDPGATEATEVMGDLPDINGFEVLDDGTIFSPAGGIGGPGSAVVIDSEAATVTAVVEGLPGVAAATVDPDGTPHLLANAGGQLFQVDVEAGTAQEIRTIATGAPFDNLSFADDGTLYLSSYTVSSLTEVSPDGTERAIPIGG